MMEAEQVVEERVTDEDIEVINTFDWHINLYTKTFMLSFFLNELDTASCLLTL